MKINLPGTRILKNKDFPTLKSWKESALNYITDWVQVGRLDQSMIVVPSFRTLPDGKLLQSPKEAKYIYKMKIIFASPNYPLYFAVPIEFGFNQNIIFHDLT